MGESEDLRAFGSAKAGALLGIRVGELEGSSLGRVGGFEIIKWKDMKLFVLKLMSSSLYLRIWEFERVKIGVL